MGCSLRLGRNKIDFEAKRIGCGLRIIRDTDHIQAIPAIMILIAVAGNVTVGIVPVCRTDGFAVECIPCIVVDRAGPCLRQTLDQRIGVPDILRNLGIRLLDE